MERVFAAGRRGDWLTQSTAVDISRQTGIARAVHAGTATVKYNVSTDCITHTDVSLHLIRSGHRQ